MREILFSPYLYPRIEKIAIPAKIEVPQLVKLMIKASFNVLFFSSL